MLNNNGQKCLLSNVSSLCSGVIPDRNVPPLDTGNISENNLIHWIQDTCFNILNVIIPDKFWSDFMLIKPTHEVSSLCHTTKDVAINVLLLVLWSCCSKHCMDEISNVLNTASQQWDNCRKYQLEEFLQTYVLCVQGHVWYSIQNLNTNDNVPTITKETPIIKEAYCLYSAVINSSAILRALSYTTQSPIPIVMEFVAFLKTINPVKVKSGEVPYVLFSDNENDNVNHVSIAQWLRTEKIRPSLRKMFKFQKIQFLSKKIQAVRSKSGHFISDTDLQELHQLACQCLQHVLRIDCPSPNSLVRIRLITYTALALDYLDNRDAKTTGLSHKDEMLITKLLQSGVLRKNNMTKGLKNLVENSSTPHFDESFLKTLLLNKFELPDLEWKLLVGKVNSADHSQISVGNE